MSAQDADSVRDVFMEAGRFRYRCAFTGHQAVSDNLIVDCLWHGPGCIDWYLQVDPAKAAGHIVSEATAENDGSVRP